MSRQSLAAVLARHRTKPPNILQALLEIQGDLGAVSVRAIPEIAKALDVTEADVAGVLSYYPELRTAQPGRHLIRVCLGESCMANHGAKVLARLRAHLKIEVGETTRDGRFTLAPIYCVGNCAVGPSLMVDGDVIGRVSPDQVPALLEEYP
ncbi:MAG: NAD(P)H-dependent oxidoreductase subunit E [Nitrospirota bacterium]|nr:NAD(P)H-dependent oxidoreductase subunit E [Nitrospirota bacterium]